MLNGMPYGDGIPKINCYSLTDLNDFDRCPFLFYVRHHLDKKYEIDDSSPAIALGHILDQSIKKFHSTNYYGCNVDELKGLIRAAVRDMKEEVEKASLRGKPHFYGSTIPYLTEEVINQATDIFTDYYKKKEGKIKESLGDVGFCEYVIKDESQNFKLWGGPDTLEMGDDGIPEVADYKSRQDIEKGKAYMDMDLMPKIYTLLCSQRLKSQGFKKARFVVRYWQDPLDDSFYEEFDLETVDNFALLFKQKIEKILNTSEIMLCHKPFCKACNSSKRDEYILEMSRFKVKIITEERVLQPELSEVTN